MLLNRKGWHKFAATMIFMPYDNYQIDCIYNEEISWVINIENHIPLNVSNGHSNT